MDVDRPKDGHRAEIRRFRFVPASVHQHKVRACMVGILGFLINPPGWR
jgi:hypothetical protein